MASCESIKNDLNWRRVSDDPFLSPTDGTIASVAVTSPDFIYSEGQMVLFVGGVEAGKERIIRLSISAGDLIKPASNLLSSAFVVLDAGPLDFDCYHVFDPATVLFKDEIYLFYSAIGGGPDSIGLARSKNGNVFQKVDHPLIAGRAPDVIRYRDQLYLFYALRSSEASYRIYLSTTDDCNTFRPILDKPVINVGSAGEWDHCEVSTPRIFKRGATYYLVYAGCNSPDRQDLPDAFGLARSEDLVNWEKYPGNPIFRKGASGQWDDGAIWFGTVFEWNDDLYLVYEGGRLEDIGNHSLALTQVGLAKLTGIEFDKFLAKW